MFATQTESFSVTISCSAFTFKEGACTKVPKIDRMFAILLLNNALSSQPENLGASSFDLNLSYSLFYLIICQLPTIFLPRCCHLTFTIELSSCGFLHHRK
jgi:hypothetical protein